MLDQNRIDDFIVSSLEDHKLTRSEKKDVRKLFAEPGVNSATIGYARNRAFEIVASRMKSPEDAHMLDWLSDFVSVLAGVKSGAVKVSKTKPAGVYFSDTHNCEKKIASLVDATRHSLDICVFTITDDRISIAIENAVKRGVPVRLITDDEKSHDLGSDVDRLARAGVDIRMDHSQAHMHHKFAIFDNAQLVTGSYNWTRGASQYNQENFIVSADVELIEQFNKEFSRLWKKFS